MAKGGWGPPSGGGGVEQIVDGDNVTVDPVGGTGVVTVNVDIGVEQIVGGTNVTVDPVGGTGVVTVNVDAGVEQIVAGTNVTIDPVGGTGDVTINVDAGVEQIIAGTNITIDPVGGTGDVTINSTGATESLTYANMIAIGSPVDGQEVYVTDNQIKETFKYDSNLSIWKHSSFVLLENGAVSTAMTIGMVVVLASAEDFACNFSGQSFDPSGIGVVAIGGAINTDILIRIIGRVTANVVTGSNHTTRGWIHPSNDSTAGSGVVTNVATGSDIGRTFEALGTGDSTCDIVLFNIPR